MRDIARRIKPDGYGVIVRTAAEGIEEAELARDVQRLTRMWEEIAERAHEGTAPARDLRRARSGHPRRPRPVLARLRAARRSKTARPTPRVHQYLSAVAPDLAERVQLHEGAEGLFDSLNVTDQMRKSLERKVWLPSGGYIVIDRAEALTVIDVNTGRFVGKTNLEDTVVKTNLEAAKEVVRQLRLRDIGGIIVIDFIDMLLARNRETVLKAFRDELIADKTKTQVIGISPLGLVEMTRKNVSEGLLETLGTPCPTCNGRGVVIEGADHDHEEAPDAGAPRQRWRRRSAGGGPGNRPAAPAARLRARTRPPNPARLATSQFHGAHPCTRSSRQVDRQFKVASGDVIEVDRISTAAEGEEVTFRPVLIVDTGRSSPVPPSSRASL